MFECLAGADVFDGAARAAPFSNCWAQLGQRWMRLQTVPRTGLFVFVPPRGGADVALVVGQRASRGFFDDGKGET